MGAAGPKLPLTRRQSVSAAGSANSAADVAVTDVTVIVCPAGEQGDVLPLPVQVLDIPALLEIF